MIIMLMLPEWDIRTHRISCHRNSFVDILSIVCHGHILYHHWLEQGCCTIFPFALCTYWYHSKYTLHKDPISPTFHQLRTMNTISHIQIHRFNIISMVWKLTQRIKARLWNDILPGHKLVLQSTSNLSEPSHAFPPLAPAVLMVLILDFIPPPHVLEQSSHCSHSFHLQSTTIT